MDLHGYQTSENDYDHLSVKNLLDAQDLYHVHLMRHPNVVATAVSPYRIRHDDSWRRAGDFFIGPRTAARDGRTGGNGKGTKKGQGQVALATHPGDFGDGFAAQLTLPQLGPHG
jgi:hypothetical protein